MDHFHHQGHRHRRQGSEGHDQKDGKYSFHQIMDKRANEAGCFRNAIEHNTEEERPRKNTVMSVAVIANFQNPMIR